jgi:hypothetical protein
MTQNYNTCPFRAKVGDQMAYIKKTEVENIVEANELTASPIIEEEKPKPQKSKLKKQVCKVLYKTDTKVAIDFLGNGFMYKDNTPDKTDQVEVTYTDDFIIESYKFI